MCGLMVRTARPDDAAGIADVYNQGIDDRVATFETRHRTADEVSSWCGGRHPIVVAVEGGRVVAFAAASEYRPRECYAGVAEASVYVARDCRGRGAGRVVLRALIDAARVAGFWKLLSRIFPENQASLALVDSLGFRRVGLYERHGQLDGRWRDVVIVEKLIDAC
jgi:L-amino acid N-acyltransferase YncA